VSSSRNRLAVRINDGYSDRHVTDYVTGLTFRKVAMGGHDSASCTLSLPRRTFTDLGPADKMYVYDARTGDTIWEGYTDNPGFTAGADGEGFELSALGGRVRASDTSSRLIYVDRTLDQFRQDDYQGQAASGTADVGQLPDDAGTLGGYPALFVQFNPGSPVSANKQVGMVYDAFKSSPMTLGAFAGFYDAGQTDAGYSLQWFTRPYVTGEANTASVSQTTAGNTLLFTAGDGNLIAGKNGFTFRLIRGGAATNVTTDNVWGGFGEVVVLGHLMNRNGALKTMSTSHHIHVPTLPSNADTDPVTAYILASEVAEDLLGRILTFCDPTTAIIDTSTAHIDQLAYTDSATPATIFDDLSLHEPNFRWGIGATNASGLHEFWYRLWDDVNPRYEISIDDGYSAPGGEVDLCNRIAVNWTDTKGHPQTTIVTSTVPALGGRVKDADAITLEPGLGSASNAARVGQLVLASKATPPKAATAVIDHPITDMLRDRLVSPWEIEPGYTVRVRETGDLIRLTEVEYSHDDGTAALTLGTPVLTTEQYVAMLPRQPVTV
jgi:hypothetical protein